MRVFLKTFAKKRKENNIYMILIIFCGVTVNWKINTSFTKSSYDLVFSTCSK